MAFNVEYLKSKVMDLRQTGADLAQTGADRARTLSNIAKLKAANLGEQETLRKAYTELGRLYFEKYGISTEPEFFSTCATIDETLAKIAINDAKIQELSAETGDTVTAEDAAEAAPEEPAAPEAETAEEPTDGGVDPLAGLDAFIDQANGEQPDDE
ncbi:MAG: hypothetical protein LUC87_10115 [Clostridiales bacterium]|nr:hypothetical protein [Clostridiales bacterium]